MPVNEIPAGEELAAELRSLADDAEELLRSSIDGDSPHMKERAQAALQDLRARLASLEAQLAARARDVDDYVRENPWAAIAIVGGVGLVIGLALGRGRR
jgi:ElaB/YqjD/DUF883 family membrane-anchored ribosome-binding protein